MSKRKKKIEDDTPVPETTEEQADVLDQEAAPAPAPDPAFVDPEAKIDPDDAAPVEDTPPVAEPEQQPLFGTADEIINVLETERSSVNLLIGKAWDTISKKKGEISELTERRANLEKAIKSLRENGMPEAEEKPGELFEFSRPLPASLGGQADPPAEAPGAEAPKTEATATEAQPGA